MKRILIYIFLLFSILFIYELYLYREYDANVIIRVFNCNPNDTLLQANILIDGKRMGTTDIEYYTCHGWEQYNYKLSFGNHRISLIKKGSTSIDFSLPFTSILVLVIDITYVDDGYFEYEIMHKIPETIL